MLDIQEEFLVHRGSWAVSAYHFFSHVYNEAFFFPNLIQLYLTALPKYQPLPWNTIMFILSRNSKRDTFLL